MVELAMRQANNNQTHAARLLDISRDALRYKLKKFGLIRADDEDDRAAERKTHFPRKLMISRRISGNTQQALARVSPRTPGSRGDVNCGQ